MVQLTHKPSEGFASDRTFHPPVNGPHLNKTDTFALNMPDTQPCPECRSTITYPTGTSQMCAECGYEWNPAEVAAEAAGPVVKDANGNILKDGDDVVMVKDLAVKGAPKALKAGTKVRGIKLVEGDHNIDCRIEGFGAMALKSEFVKKA
jgi:protein PhnA